MKAGSPETPRFPVEWLFFRSQDAFKEQTDRKPYREIIQSDHMPDMPLGTVVIPGTAIFPPEQQAAYIFCKQDREGIDGAAKQERAAVHPAGDGLQKGRKPINWKHPQRSLAQQAHIPFLKGVQSGKNYLKTPAKNTAFYEIVQKGFESVVCFHENSIVYSGTKYAKRRLK